MFDTGEPFTRTELADALTRVHAQGAAWLDTLPDETFFAPQGSAWSPAGHIRHLRKAAAPLAQALQAPRLLLRLRFGRPPLPSRPFAEVRTAYLAALAAGGQAGRFTPSPEAAPADLPARRREIMTSWQAANIAVARGIGRWSDAGLDHTCVPHPLMGKMTLRDIVGFTAYHTAHHLERIAERAAQAD